MKNKKSFKIYLIVNIIRVFFTYLTNINNYLSQKIIHFLFYNRSILSYLRSYFHLFYSNFFIQKLLIKLPYYKKYLHFILITHGKSHEKTQKGKGKIRQNESLHVFSQSPTMSDSVIFES